MMQEMLLNIIEAVKTGDREQTIKLVQEALSQNMDPLTVLNEALSTALRQVGEEYEKGERFIFDMIASGEAVNAASGLLQVHTLGEPKDVKSVARLVIGTVQGDIHSIGKDIVTMMLRGSGFEVIDLGVDVSVRAFVDALRKDKPDLLGMSALMTSTMDVQEQVVDELKKNALRNDVKVMIGGAPITETWAKHIGADAYGADAVDAIRKAKSLLGIQKVMTSAGCP